VSHATGVRTGHGPDGAGSRWRALAPNALAWVVRVTAVVSLIDIVSSSSRHYFSSAAADAAADGSSFAIGSAVAGLQLLLAAGLRRRKRRAWWLLVGVAAAGVLTHLERTSLVALSCNVVLLVLLVVSRAEFTARAESVSRPRVAGIFVLMAGVSFAAGLALTADESPSSTWSQRLSSTFFGLFGFTPDLPFRDPGLSSANQVALTTMGVVTVAVTLLALLAPARKRARLEPGDEQRLRGLLAVHGARDSLGYFALRRDKSVLFSATGKAAIAYRVVGGVSLASGDPIGDPEAWPAAIRCWLEEAGEFAWVPGVIGCSEEGATAFVRAGLDSLEVGDEAVLDLCEFTLEGRAHRGLRQAVGRVRRAGYTTSVSRQRDLSSDELAELRRAVDRFRNGDVERGFSMALGRIGDPADGDLVVASARDCEGEVAAVLVFVPWGEDGLSLDLMRRSGSSENGTVELLVVAVSEAARELGVVRLSLNFAVFRSAFDRGSRVGAGPALRLWRQVLLLASRWWQIESLYRANAKYSPGWVPRFVCFRRASELPRVTLAALEAEAFVVRPRLFRPYG
jgi:lysyl-tRNA synthetase class 2